jgi:hypothetical protein
MDTSMAFPIPPAAPNATMYAMAPATVAASRTGKTALSLTLAFFDTS